MLSLQFTQFTRRVIPLVAVVSLALVGFTPILVAIGEEVTTPDPRLTEADTAFAAGVKLVQEGSPESLQQALVELNQALILYQQLGLGSQAAETFLGLGLVYKTLGDLRASLEAYQEALSYYQSSDRILDAAYSLNQIGKIHYELGNYQKAVEVYQQAIIFYTQGGDLRGKAYALNNLGAVYEPLGKFQEALEAYTQALELHERANNRVGLASSLNNLGLLYDALGNFELSLDYYKRSLSLWQELNDVRGEASTLNNIGLYHESQDDFQPALQSFQQALGRYQEIGDLRGEATTLNNIGFTYTRLENWNAAQQSYQQALPLWEEIGNRSGLGSTLNNIGVVSAALGEFDRALEFYQQALVIRQEIGDRSREALSLYRIAIAQRELGNQDDSLMAIQAAIEIIEDLRTHVVSQDLRTSFFASKQEYYEFYIDLLMDFHQQNPGQGYDGLALAVSERAKARSLLDLLAEISGEVQGGIDPQILAEKQQIQQQLAAAEERRIQLLSQQHTDSQKTAIDNELEQLLIKYRSILGQIRATSPRYAALTKPEPLNLAEIQESVIDKDSVLLAYFVGEKRSFLWIVTHNYISSYELPGREVLEAETKRFRDSFIFGNLRIRRTLAENAGKNLGQILLEPLSNYTDKSRVLIVPYGVLNFVPFVALAYQSSDEEYRPLIITREVVTLPSASALAVLRNELFGRQPAERYLAILADPVFGTNDERLHNNNEITSTSLPPDLEQSARESGILFDRLPFTQTEAEQIVSLFPAESFSKEYGFAATREVAISDKMSQYRIIHYATHGILNSQNPELSGLVLSLVNPDGQPVNGFVRLHDIFNLNLPADLVVLSACETGLGQQVRGEGLVGLTRGFMYAGAARVVVSLWSVDDQATAELMVLFYRYMLDNGLSPAAALRQAQIEIWQNSQWHSPYYWAGFTIQGEWQN
ncbi:CHAT domain-containing tetratricopeptide repeat protein [Limnospira platensis]|uniref:CHAT domain-containing tetratricopeptide repeat protein n=1 Tax=Limnospira platensis TaxID=118562 RepID=UPI00028040FD|nr:tetratricopeptide TPR_2 repeat protein [Arthrospira platensis C1]UWU50430.1 CHAT domain-containing protein [Arthrospira platensis C1]